MKYQDPTELTPAQKKAVAGLRRAYTAAKKANVYFYSCLGNLHALNGNLVEAIVTDDQFDIDRADCSLREFDSPEKFATVNGEFADDEHYVVFKKSAKEQDS